RRASTEASDRRVTPLSRFRRLPMRRLGAALTIGAVGAGIGVSRAADQSTRVAMKHGMLPAARVTSSLMAGNMLAGAEWDLPNIQHDRVDYWVERFTTDK